MCVVPACTLCLFSVAEYLIRFFILTLSIIILISNKFLCGFLEGMNTRNGTDVDAANAMKVFSKLGYKVKVHNDQTVAQIRQLLTSGELEAEPDLYRSSSSQRAVTQSCHTFLIFFSCKGRSQPLCLFRLCPAESWWRGCVVWYRWLHRDQVPHVAFSRRSLQLAGGKAQTVLHPGMFMFPLPPSSTNGCHHVILEGHMSNRATVLWTIN